MYKEIIERLKQPVRDRRKKKLLHKFRNIDATAQVNARCYVYTPDNLIMAENTKLSEHSIIMNTRAKFILKKNSGAALGLLVVTGNHMNAYGKFVNDVGDKEKEETGKSGQYDKDVIVEEDVWIGAKVILLSGAHIGRGVFVGAGSVVRGNIPPYSIVVGNPAKVIEFRFSPEEIVEHEKILYPENERISYDRLIKNYKKYYLDRIKQICDYITP